MTPNPAAGPGTTSPTHTGALRGVSTSVVTRGVPGPPPHDGLPEGTAGNSEMNQTGFPLRRLPSGWTDRRADGRTRGQRYMRPGRSTHGIHIPGQVQNQKDLPILTQL